MSPSESLPTSFAHSCNVPRVYKHEQPFLRALLNPYEAQRKPQSHQQMLAAAICCWLPITACLPCMSVCLLTTCVSLPRDPGSFLSILLPKKKVQAHSNPNPGNDKTLSIILGLKYGWSTSRHQCECHRRKKQWWVFPARGLKAPGAQVNLKTDFPYRKAEKKTPRQHRRNQLALLGTTQN